MESKNHYNYMPSLDGLRGFGCMLVVFSHINFVLNGLIPHGSFVLGSSGVLIFFSLSGFLMGTLYLQKTFDYKTASQYVVSRLSRITPAYYIAILTVLAISLFIVDFEYDMDALMIARSFAFMGSAGVFWSIPPEVQFYAFFLLIWAGYHRAKEGKYDLAIAATIMSLAFIATRDIWGGILLPSKLHIFLFGMLGAYLIFNQDIRTIIGHPLIQTLIVAVTLTYMFLYVTEKTLYHDLFIAALVALSVASLSQSTFATKFFELGFMRVLGAASFSIYLFHDALLRATYYFFDFTSPMWVQLIMCLCIALVPTIAFHYLVERGLNKKSKDLGLRITTSFQKKYLKAQPIV